jgi:DNA-directed RNA polymerase subunit E"
MKACKQCFTLTEENVCPRDNTPTSKHWQGYVVIADPKRSRIARKMNIKVPGKYALKVR